MGLNSSTCKQHSFSETIKSFFVFYRSKTKEAEILKHQIYRITQRFMLALISNTMN